MIKKGFICIICKHYYLILMLITFDTVYLLRLRLGRSGGIWILVVGTDAGLNLHIRQQIICEKAVATEGKFFVINVIGSDFENIIILNIEVTPAP